MAGERSKVLRARVVESGSRAGHGRLRSTVVFNAIEQLKAIDGDLETMSQAGCVPEVAAECERTRRMVREVIGEGDRGDRRQ